MIFVFNRFRQIYRQFIFIILFTGIAIISKAQPGVGIHAGLVNWLTNEGLTKDGKPVGFYTPSSGSFWGFQLAYIIKPKIRVNLSADIVSTQYQITTSASSTTLFGSMVFPTSYVINITTPVNFYHAEGQYSFYGDFLKTGLKIYGFAGIAFNDYTYTATTVDNGYAMTGSPYSIYNTYTQSYQNLSATFGPGTEYAFNDVTRLFLEFRFGTGQKPIYDDNNVIPENFNPFHFSTTLGLRFNLAN